jgi:DNA replication factor GINS
MVVRLLKEIPEIVGADMKTYGPFKPEDVATVPKENAKTLIKQGLAVEVEIR